MVFADSIIAEDEFHRKWNRGEKFQRKWTNSNLLATRNFVEANKKKQITWTVSARKKDS
jgi:hypothetical protein